MLSRQILNYIAMIAAAAIIAGIIVLIPTLVSQAGASDPANSGLTAPRFGATCSQKAWPYYEPACTFRTGTNQPSQDVRIVTADRVAN
jgi:hypothetical protein